jgi:hypothetical protein
VYQLNDGPFRWLHSGDEVDIASVIALHESEDEGPNLGRADGAYAIVDLVGGDVAYQYHQYCYGAMSYEQYLEDKQAGFEYATKYIAQYGMDMTDPVPVRVS